MQAEIEAFDVEDAWRTSAEWMERLMAIIKKYVGAGETKPLTRWDADFTKEPYMKVSSNGEWVRFVDVAGETAQPASEEEKRKGFELAHIDIYHFDPNYYWSGREYREHEIQLRYRLWMARSRRNTE